MINIDVNSWHYKMNRKMFKDSVRLMEINGTSLCEYMILTIGSIIKLVAVSIAISFLVCIIVSVFVMLGVAVYMSFYTGIGENFEAFVKYNDYIISLHPILIAILASIISFITITIGYLICKLVGNYHRYKRKKLALALGSKSKESKQPNMFMEYLRNKRDRVCVQVKFTNKDQSK